MKKNYITVLDQEVGEVFQYEIDLNPLAKHDFDYEKFLSDKGHRLNNIEWMVHNEPTVRRMYFTN